MHQAKHLFNVTQVSHHRMLHVSYFNVFLANFFGQIDKTPGKNTSKLLQVDTKQVCS